MRTTLIIPTESPPTLREIKRALLCFDKVLLVDPSDRDVIPPNAWMSSIIGLPLIGMSAGAVRPLGKIADYDSKFQKLLEEIEPASAAGLVEVISTYDQAATSGFTIGAVPTGGYPLAPQFVMEVYRSVASNQQLLCQSLDESALRALIDPNNLETLVLSGVGDNGINDIPGLPLIEFEGLSQDQLAARTSLARGRIASLVKFTGYCETKEIIPTLPNEGYSNVMASLIENTKNLLINDSDDGFWVNRNRVLELAFQTILEPNSLDKIPVPDVIKMRTQEWGTFEDLRRQLFKGVFELTSAGEKDDNFEKYVNERLVAIRKTASEIESQRKSIAFRIKCELGAGLLGGGLSLTTLQAPLTSVAAVLAIGGVWALQRTAAYSKELFDLKQQEQEAERGAGFAMSRFLAKLKNRA